MKNVIKLTKKSILVTLFGLLIIFLIICLYSGNSSQSVENFSSLRDLECLKEALSVKLDVSPRRLNSLNITGDLNTDNYNIRFKLLPRNLMENEQMSNTDVEIRINRLIEDDNFILNACDKEYRIKNINIENIERGTSSGMDLNGSNPFKNPTFKDIKQYIDDKPIPYNHDLDRTFQVDSSIK